MGKPKIETAPMSIVTKAITFASTGRSMKNLESIGLPVWQRFDRDLFRVGNLIFT